MNIKIYGSRGTMPFFNRNGIRYGGNTSCVRVDAAGRIIVLDCGSGLSQFYHDAYVLPSLGDNAHLPPEELDILLSHLHIDHLIGLSNFPPIFGNNNIRIHTKSRKVQSLASQIFGIFKPPYWPVPIAEINRAELLEIDEEQPFMLGDVKVTPHAAKHPDSTTCFRIDAEKSLVYMLDYEADTMDNLDTLATFCVDADAIIFDATYSPEDYPSKRGWGHSTFEAGVKLANMSNCHKMIFSHLCQDYDDAKIDLLSERLLKLGQGFQIAFDGMELEL